MIHLFRKIYRHGIFKSLNILTHKIRIKYRSLLIKSGRYEIRDNSFLLDNSFRKLCSYLDNYRKSKIENAGLNTRPEINNDFHLLGKNYSFHDKINWHFISYDQNKSYPNIYAPGVKIMDYNRYGDYRITWELNRTHYFVWLAQAFALSGDQKYFIRLKRDLNDWIDNNNAGYGVNYVSPMEISIRLINWLVSLIICQNVVLLDHKFIKSILSQLIYLNDNLFFKTRKLKNNHSIVEIAGLIIFQSILNISSFPQLKKLYEMLFTELEVQFYDDGCNFEHSPTYTRFTLESLFLILLLENSETTTGYRNDLSYKIHKYAKTLRLFITPSNSVPLLSDCDNGRVIFLEGHNRNFNDFRGFFDFLGFYFHDDTFFISENFSDINAETKWWCILAGIEPEYLNSLRTSSALSSLLPDGGYYIYNDPNMYVVFKSGYPGNKLLIEEYAPHVHQDLLAIECYLNNEPILVDSGTYTYDLSDNGYREYFRSPEAHNTITINKAPQFKFSGAFGANSFPEVSISSIADNEVLGIVNYKEQLTIKRRITVTQKKILVCDSAESSSLMKEIEIYLNLHPDISIQNHAKSKNQILLKSSSEKIYLISLPEDTKITLLTGWYSNSYNCKSSANKILLSVSGINKTFSFSWSLEYLEHIND